MINDADPSPRWAAYSHEEILAMVRAGPGGAASQYAAGRWEATWFTVSFIEANLARAIAEAGSGWAGQAAEAMATGTTPLGQWAGRAAAQAQATARTVEAQAGYADYTRREMPPLPHPEIPTDPVRTPRPYMSGVPIMTDWAAVESDRDAATARARDLMVTYDRNSYGTVPGLLESQAPPTVVVQNTATGTVHGAGVAVTTAPAASSGSGDGTAAPPLPRSTARSGTGGANGGEPGAAPADGPVMPAGPPAGSGPAGTAAVGSTPSGSGSAASAAGGPLAGTSGPGLSGSGRHPDTGSGVGSVLSGPYGAAVGRQPGSDRAGPGPEQGRTAGSLPRSAADPGRSGGSGSEVFGGGSARPGPGSLADPSTGRSLPGSGSPADGSAPGIPHGPGSLGDPASGTPRSPAGSGSLSDPWTGGFGGPVAGRPLPEPATLDRGSPERPFPSSAPPTGRIAGEGLMPMGAGGMGRARGEEHRRPPYLVDDGSAFADDRHIPGSVINEGWPRA